MPTGFVDSHNKLLCLGIQVLLSKGAKIGVKDGRGRTPLHVATEHGAPASALSLLAQNSSDANAVDDDSMTPLHLLVSVKTAAAVDSTVHPQHFLV